MSDLYRRRRGLGMWWDHKYIYVSFGWWERIHDDKLLIYVSVCTGGGREAPRVQLVFNDIRIFWWWFVRKFALFGPFSEVFWCITAWQALLLVNSEVRVTHDWLIEWNGTVDSDSTVLFESIRPSPVPSHVAVAEIGHLSPVPSQVTGGKKLCHNSTSKKKLLNCGIH